MPTTKFKKYIILFILVLVVNFIHAQVTFEKDTSYTIHSAYKKISKHYPEILPAQTTTCNKFKTFENQVYLSRPNRELHLDVVVPTKKNKKAYPVVLMIHGGGWRSGDKSLLLPIAQFLAKNGYVAVPVEYRLSVEALYPAAIYDLKEAVKFLKQNALHYNIDTTEIAVLGSSAGATLAGLLTTTWNKLEEPNSNYQNISAKVQAYINIDGVVDFTNPAESGKDTNPNKPSAGALFFGYTYAQNPQIWQEASPINYISHITTPTLFINSSRPRFHAGRDEFIDTLNAKNIYTEVHTIENTPHSFWLFHPWYDQTCTYVLNFLNKTFK